MYCRGSNNCYPPLGRYAYCETCWLFGDKAKSPWADKIVPSKKNGISKKIKTHETSDSGCIILDSNTGGLKFASDAWKIFYHPN